MIPLTIVSTEKSALESYLKSINAEERGIVIRIEPKKTEFSIEQIKEIVREVAIYQPFKRTYVLEDFHVSSLEAQNAFLKTLEEVPANIQFILSVSNIYQLLPTIISRTKIVYIKKFQEGRMDEVVKKKLSRFLVQQNMSLLADKQFAVTSKTDALALLIQIILFFRDRFTIDRNAPEIVREIIRIKNLMENNNINPSLALDNLLIFIKKKYSMK